MSTTQTERCLFCGSAMFHLDRDGNIICTMCGRPINQMNLLRERQSYQQDIQRAIQYIQVNDFQKAKAILTSLLTRYPVDVRIYQMLLECMTGRWQNLCFDMRSNDLAECARYWEALKNLPNGLNPQLRQYAENRRRALIDKLNGVRVRLTVCFAFAGLLGLCGASRAGFGLYELGAAAVLIGTCSSGWYNEWVTLSKRIKEIKDNPFKA